MRIFLKKMNVIMEKMMDCPSPLLEGFNGSDLVVKNNIIRFFGLPDLILLSIVDRLDPKVVNEIVDFFGPRYEEIRDDFINQMSHAYVWDDPQDVFDIEKRRAKIIDRKASDQEAYRHYLELVDQWKKESEPLSDDQKLERESWRVFVEYVLPQDPFEEFDAKWFCHPIYGSYDEYRMFNSEWRPRYQRYDTLLDNMRRSMLSVDELAEGSELHRIIYDENRSNPFEYNLMLATEERNTDPRYALRSFMQTYSESPF
jgi:hypothetical protein